MKFKQSVFALSIGALLVAAPLHAGRQGPGQGQAGTVAQEVVSESLSGDEAAGLVFMREEEKLARDVYLTLYDLWQHPVFSSISQAEQKHMDTMGALVDNYGLDDPVIDDSIGAFDNQELSDLYKDLTSEEGRDSLLDALYAGAWIEEIDIRDLQEAIAASSHQDLLQAYENLQRGSRNHLRAFVRQIELLGVVYVAQVLEQNEVDDILDSPLERGRPGGNGRRGR